MHTQAKYNHFICITLIISLLALWVFCGIHHTNPSFFRASSATPCHSATLVQDTSEQDTGIISTLFYRFILNKNILVETDEIIQSGLHTRSLSILRFYHFFLSLFLILRIFLLVPLAGICFWFLLTCTNLYHVRTLTYIHHKDGKKAS